jgi:hypothetical protein
MMAALLPVVRRFSSVATPKYFLPWATNFVLMLLLPPVLVPEPPLLLEGLAAELVAVVVDFDSVVEGALVVGGALVVPVPGRHWEYP